MLYKFLQCDALPRTTVEHLVLQSSEKAFTGWIVWRTSFPRHGPGEPRILDSLDPAGPSVMAASIRMNNWMGTLWKRKDCTVKHSIYQLRIWFAANVPCYRHSIIAIDNRREIYLSSRYWELCHVGQPLLIRFVSPEIPLYYIWHLRTNFSFVWTILPCTSAFYQQSIFTHDPADHLFR